ncbi:ABC transporter permease [Allostreptomyces psammosilenae]|uniref:Putative ABC transport system permease protein n=1 Tax=Allostreptomyces psammosilenae TaxID=1892865 RepID=A0A852ZRD2_9ACTN|nr:FtsX-like permease family protein [Allostreptomyces psammosilenae]NYI04929.1 putative ABC transport system permease protein [Allostreptomyces psammosilenae]
MLKATLRSFLAHRGRLVLSALAITLSVAFVAGTLIFTDTINRTFENLFRSTSPDVSVTAHEEVANDSFYGTPSTVPAELVDRIAAVDGVRQAQGDVSVESLTVVDDAGEPVGPTTGAPTIGGNWYTSDDPADDVVVMDSGRAPETAGEVVIDKDTADNRGIALGDTLRVISPAGEERAEVVGVARFTTANPGAALVFFDTATAQALLLGEQGVFTSVAVAAADGVADADLKERIAAAVGDQYEVRTADEQAATAAESIGSFLDVVRYAMLGFAGISLLVGVFLIFNTFSMLVAQRTRELGLLRAIGAGRGDVNRSVLTEAVLLGVVGATTGLAAGVGLAVLLRTLMESAGLNLDASLVFTWTTPVAAYLVGVLVTLIAAYVPARRAGRISPMAALREAGAPATTVGRARTVAGLVLLAGGVAALVAGTTAEETTTGGLLLGVGIPLTLVGLVVAGPATARLAVRGLGAALPRTYGTVGRMSRNNALRNPRRTGATAAALMIGVALVGAIAVTASSLERSIGGQLDRAVGADYILSGTTPFPAAVADRVRETEGVGTVTEVRGAPARAVAGDYREEVSVTAVTPNYDEAMHTEYQAGSGAEALAAGQAVISHQTAEAGGVGLGDTLELTFPDGRTARLEIGAITAEDSAAASVTGTAPMISLDTLAEYVPGSQDFLVLAAPEPGADSARVLDALDAALADYPQVEVRDQAEYKELLSGQINGVLTLVYGLLALAIIIAILGVVNTLALSVIERTTEIGMLRAIGTSRPQVRRMVRLESVLIAVYGALLGLVLGLVWGVAAQRVLATQGVDVLVVPWSTIVVVLLGAVVVGLVAAILPARRASRMNVLAAIAHE